MLPRRTPLGPPIRSADGVTPAPFAPSGSGTDVDPPQATQNTLGWRLTAALVGLIASATPLATFSFFALRQLRDDSTPRSAGSITVAMTAAFVVSGAVGVPCFYIAGSDQWRRVVRWWRAALTWPAAMVLMPLTASLVLAFGAFVLPDSWLSSIERSPVEPYLFVAGVYLLPIAVALVGVLAITGVLNSRGRFPARPRDLSAPDRH